MIAILDFGSQYNQLIARRVRECRVYCEILNHDIAPGELESRKVEGIILSGGPSSIFDKGVPKCDPGIFELGVPVLGICYGVQLMAHLLGGKVVPSSRREYGLARLDVRDRSGLLKGIKDKGQVWMSHGDRVEKVPPRFTITGRTANTKVFSTVFRRFGRIRCQYLFNRGFLFCFQCFWTHSFLLV